MNYKLIDWLDIQERRFYKTAGKIILAFSSEKRPSSYPYVTGDSFRKLADHIHDETGSFDPTIIKKADIVFVSQPEIHNFLDTIHHKINQPYVLIVHNGDKSFDQEVCAKIDRKIIHCFAQDVTYEHPKVTPIPIGLANKYYFINGLTWLFDKIRSKIKLSNIEKAPRILFSFSVETNRIERQPALDVLNNIDIADTPHKFLQPIRYTKLASKYMFVASPPGNAIESNRTWEALYVGTIPIVKDFVAMRHFSSIGLPIWIITDWNELNGITEEQLAEKYSSLMSKANTNPLHMDYWIEQIENVRTLYIKQHDTTY